MNAPLNTYLAENAPADELRAWAQHLLIESDPTAKRHGVANLWGQWQAGALRLDCQAVLTTQAVIPGRPLLPVLVPPKELKHRSMRTVEGRAALIHALAHIEFNAMNLALDAIWRFPEMPEAFYADWLLVAKEEAYHFSLLVEHLTVLGFHYGYFAAHNSLWEMAEKTKGDVLARIALVPRVYEARGLDAVPPIRAKLAQAGDSAGAAIMDIIMHDEVGHVAIGNQWYGWLCATRALAPIPTFAELSLTYKAPVYRGPFNLDARRAAGFSEEELALFMLATT